MIGDPYNFYDVTSTIDYSDFYNNLGVNDTTTSERANWMPCELDNKITFLTAATCQFDEGPVKCDAADPQTESFPWSLLTNDTQMVLDGDTLNIYVNDGTRLEFGQTMVEYEPNSTTVIATVDFRYFLIR